jgi:arylsulfatase A-like enzyme
MNRTRDNALERSSWILRTVCIASVLATAVAANEHVQRRAEQSPSPRALPNVILILIDTLRADHLGSYGYERPTSPAIDRLATEGARFENAYSQASSTVPSHASLFTGRYPFQHNTYGHATALPADELTLAEFLADYGYRRFAITSSARFEESSGFHQGFEDFEVLRTSKVRRSSKLIARARSTIERDDARPYFAFLHFFDPHEPYAPPERLEKKWHPGVEGLSPADTSEFLQTNRLRANVVPPDTLDYLRALYDAEILYLDEMLGDFFEWLAGRDDERGTIIVLTSDHGEEFKEHGGLSHSRNTHEELLRVPLIFHFPGRVESGATISTPVQGVDVFPTLVELLGLALPAELPGRSFAKLLTGGELETGASELNLVAAQQKPTVWSLAADLETGRFKLTAKPEQSQWLYRLDDDPGAHRDIAAQFPTETKRMQVLADELGISNAPPWPPADTQIEVPAEVLDQLRAIGYAEEVDGAQPQPESADEPVSD